MDDLRNDSCLRHFKCRSTTFNPQHVCLNSPIHNPQPFQINVEYDDKQFGGETSMTKWVYIGTSREPTKFDKINARRALQTYMADS